MQFNRPESRGAKIRFHFWLRLRRFVHWQLKASNPTTSYWIPLQWLGNPWQISELIFSQFVLWRCLLSCWKPPDWGHKGMQLVSDSTQIGCGWCSVWQEKFPRHHRTTDTSSLDCWDKEGWFRKDSCCRGEVTTICSLGQKFRITRSGCVLSSICTVSMSLCFLWPQISIVCQQELRSSSACLAHLSPGFSSAQMKSFPLTFSSTKHSFQQNCPLYNPALALQTVVANNKWAFWIRPACLLPTTMREQMRFTFIQMSDVNINPWLSSAVYGLHCSLIG